MVISSSSLVLRRRTANSWDAVRQHITHFKPLHLQDEVARI